ncbi:hypothetical protein LJC04_03500 [Ruminococcaceae bacterium OttesenSCG-928-O06]|nr:hypothetical protein [Ruminococcaceae bacterium OttesenSCG-928-O06]
MKRELMEQPEMEKAMTEKKTTSKLYKVESDIHRGEELAKKIQHKMVMLREFPPSSQNTIFNDIDVVKYRTEIYLSACAESGCIPSVMGLATLGYGVSRQALDKYLREHQGSEVTRYIEVVKDVFITDILSDMALQNQTNGVVSIFLLKNQSGMRDNLELHTPYVGPGPLGRELTREEILEQLPNIREDESYD